MKRIILIIGILLLLTSCSSEPVSNQPVVAVVEDVDIYEVIAFQEERIEQLRQTLQEVVETRFHGEVSQSFDYLKGDLIEKRENYLELLEQVISDEAMNETVEGIMNEHASMTQTLLESLKSSESKPTSKADFISDLEKFYGALVVNYEQKIDDLKLLVPDVVSLETVILQPQKRIVFQEYIQEANQMLDNLIFNDPYLRYQWGLYDIGMHLMWHQDFEVLGTVKIAIIDTGIDYEHEDLIGRVNVSLGYDFVNDDTDAYDDNGHGTHVAGIIGATANNNIGIVGVMGTLPVEMIPVKVLDENGSGNIEDIVAGIEYSIELEVDIINMSVGAYLFDAELRDVLLKAKEAGIVVVTAAGNDNVKTNYSTLTRNEVTFTVGATNRKHEKASFSNYGRFVDIAAPGTQIMSTVPNNEYEAWDGTSMATPIVTGVIGYLMTVEPDLTPEKITLLLSQTAEPLDVSHSLGAGIVSAKRMSILLSRR